MLRTHDYNDVRVHKLQGSRSLRSRSRVHAHSNTHMQHVQNLQTRTPAPLIGTRLYSMARFVTPQTTVESWVKRWIILGRSTNGRTPIRCVVFEFTCMLSSKFTILGSLYPLPRASTSLRPRPSYPFFLYNSLCFCLCTRPPHPTMPCPPQVAVQKNKRRSVHHNRQKRGRIVSLEQPFIIEGIAVFVSTGVGVGRANIFYTGKRKV